MQKGFTLIELIISLSLIVIILVVTFFVYSNMYKGYIQYTDEIDMQQNIRLAMHKIVSELKKVNDENRIKLQDGGTKLVLLFDGKPKEDIYYKPETRCIYIYSNAYGVELAYNIDGFSVSKSNNIINIKIIQRNKVLSASVKLMYNSGEQK